MRDFYVVHLDSQSEGGTAKNHFKGPTGNTGVDSHKTNVPAIRESFILEGHALFGLLRIHSSLLPVARNSSNALSSADFSLNYQGVTAIFGFKLQP